MHEEWLKEGPTGPMYGAGANWKQFGVMRPTQGARTDLQEFYKLVKDGKSDAELADINFSAFSRTLKAIDRIRFQTRPPCNQAREVILLTGPPGVGKTKWAYDHYPDLFELAIGSSVWFDGYHGQETVLLDEFEGEMPLTSALKVLDPYYVRMAPIKGSFVWWNPSRIIVTSNTHPANWYKWTGREVKEEALRRRFSKIYSGLELKEETDVKYFWPLAADGQFNAEDQQRQF